MNTHLYECIYLARLVNQLEEDLGSAHSQRLTERKDTCGT